MMGPIIDKRGLEQGEISSSDAYKLYNNEQAIVAQSSGLGVPIYNNIISCISLADDAVLLANSIYDLTNLLLLTTKYCNKYDVKLVPEKIQLVSFQSGIDPAVDYEKSVLPVIVDGQIIPFRNQASHLGVVRSAQSDNSVSIMDRLAAHRRQLFSLLPAGMALHHYSNPAASIKVHQIYCLPVLCSGLASLVLKKSEIKIISNYFKTNLLRLMKLLHKTPDSAVYYLAGTIPAEGHLHLRQLSLFSMICHLEQNILKDVAFASLSSKSFHKSWFQQVSTICEQYNLPDPLSMLGRPPPKKQFNKQCKIKIIEYWHNKLSVDACNLPSLRYLNASFLSLTRPHPIWASLDSNPYQARAASVQALFLSGRYRTEKLCRFWSQNKDGDCLLYPCLNLKHVEDRKHILLQCAALERTRRRLYQLSLTLISDMPLLAPIIREYLYSEDDEVKMQFILDCSTLPLVIQAHQFMGPIVHQTLFKLTRTWCHSLHRSRMRMLGRFCPV